MASSNTKNPNPSPHRPTFPNGFDRNSSPNTTYVQADPSTFRAVVQRLTGASSPSPKPAHHHHAKPTNLASDNNVMGPRRPAFKLHERRPRKLDMVNLNNNNNNTTLLCYSPCARNLQHARMSSFLGENKNNMVMASPVSPLDHQYNVARSPVEEMEERAIAEKGFYLHPSPLSTPRGSEPPELLPLFPLHSPS